MLERSEKGRELLSRYGAPAVGMFRRLGPDGPYDRRIVKDGYIVNYTAAGSGADSESDGVSYQRRMLQFAHVSIIIKKHC